MKRVLTGIAAAGVVLGMTVPTAFAATNSSMNMSTMKWKQTSITLDGSSIGFKSFAAPYAGTQTTYMPIYYLNEYLKKMGFSATWNGVSKTWFLNTPARVTPNLSNLSTAGQHGTATIAINGVPVQMITPKFAKDPASHVETTYMPIYFLIKVLQEIGLPVTQSGNWNGTTLSLVQPAATTTSSTSASQSLSNLTVSGQTVGTGSDASPAVGIVNNAVKFSTTVMDANGNPVSTGSIVQFLVSTTDNLTVTDGNGNVLNSATLSAPIVIGNKTYDAYYSAPVGSNGVASLSVTSNASTTNEPLYVVAQLPAETNGNYIRSSAATAEWGLPGTLVLSPLWGTSGNPDELNFSTTSNATQGLIPVVATMLPETGSSTSVAGQEVK
ncbi:MAG: hypothetical protein OWQ59_06110, partial [Alicyclobacillaceae bacterium]|nr:hypothetical protein [Alicyclobacillaceae bacterium]